MEQYAVSEQEAMEDFMMVGLRMLDGVRSEDFRSQFNCAIEEVFGPVIDRLCRLGLLERTEEGYRLSRQGLLYGNDVFGAFIGSAQLASPQGNFIK